MIEQDDIHIQSKSDVDLKEMVITFQRDCWSSAKTTTKVHVVVDDAMKEIETSYLPVIYEKNKSKVIWGHAGMKVGLCSFFVLSKKLKN